VRVISGIISVIRYGLQWKGMRRRPMLRTKGSAFEAVRRL
jgi:hypothetical protein